MLVVHVAIPTWKRVVFWMIFVAFVAAAPIILSWLFRWLTGSSMRFSEFFAEGDGFLIAIALTADALGRAFEQQTVPIFRVIGCGIILLLALACFSVPKLGKMTQADDIDRDRASCEKDVQQCVSVVRDLDHRYFDLNRVAEASYIVVGAGLITAFMVVIKD